MVEPPEESRTTSGNYGKNEWVGSAIQTYLNDEVEYYTRTGTAANYGLKATAKSLISDVKYYLGGMHEIGTVDAMYLWERGSEVFSYENYCLYHSALIQLNVQLTSVRKIQLMKYVMQQDLHHG